MYFPIIFPTLLNTTWAAENLGQLSQEAFPNTSYKNALLNPDFCDQWVRSIAQKLQVDYTYGGHFEDRQHLWRGYYENADNVTHLGVDYNVPSGTPVAAPRNCFVYHSWKDNSTDNGWGGRLILKLSTPWQGADYLIFGHLAHQDLPGEGISFLEGEIIATTGMPSENGGWFPHLHVQCVSQALIDLHQEDLTLLDGYYLIPGEPYHLAPDPTLLVGKNC